MNAITPQVVASYLAQLDAALVGVPVDLRADIVAGIREELTGLDAAQAAARIEDLGDPAFIAAEARAALPEKPAPLPASSLAPLPAEPRTATVLIAIAVMIGGVIVPFLGAFVALVLVAVSRAWTVRQKLFAILAPFIAVVLVVGVGALFALGSKSDGNPLVPVHADGLVSFFLALFVDGIWLLFAARRNARS